MTKFELSISTQYVPNWGIVEAFRELFQNALDNEIENPGNEMGFVYDEDSQSLRITNKTSSLTADTLLLGSTTKANEKKTIGQHGEGYKIAFMVLLRNEKKITVYNYGAREMWTVRLVKSKKYNNQYITTVFVDKKYPWSRVPDNDLTILVEGITREEYDEVVQKNLHLRPVRPAMVESKNGRILTDKEEAGNIYIKGLFIANKIDFKYGYDFEPGIISLDRDRRVLDSMRLAFETAQLWADSASEDDNIRDVMIRLFKQGALDARYITQSWITQGVKIDDMIAEDFIRDYGGDAIPVVSNVEYEAVQSSGRRPVIVTNEIKEAIERSNYSETVIVEEPKSVKELFKEFFNKVSCCLTDEDAEYMEELIEKIAN